VIDISETLTNFAIIRTAKPKYLQLRGFAGGERPAIVQIAENKTLVLLIEFINIALYGCIPNPSSFNCGIAGCARFAGPISIP
jgi:hypothetical protein